MSTPPVSSSSTENVHWQELQETVSRLSSHPGVQAVLILNRAGDIVVESSSRSSSSRSTTPASATVTSPSASSSSPEEDAGITSQEERKKSPHTRQAKLTRQLYQAAQAYLASWDDENDPPQQEEDPISFVHVRSKGHRELMLAPHEGFLLAVLKH